MVLFEKACQGRIDGEMTFAYCGEEMLVMGELPLCGERTMSVIIFFLGTIMAFFFCFFFTADTLFLSRISGDRSFTLLDK